MEITMPSLFIDLQDGFSDDTVIVKVNDRQVFHKDNVNTDYALGRADSVEISIHQDQVVIEVDVPFRRLSDTLALESTHTIYLGISIIEDRIDFRISDKRFLYF